MICTDIVYIIYFFLKIVFLTILIIFHFIFYYVAAPRKKRQNAAQRSRDEIGRTEVILSPTLIPLRIVANYTNFRKGT